MGAGAPAPPLKMEPSVTPNAALDTMFLTATLAWENESENPERKNEGLHPFFRRKMGSCPGFSGGQTFFDVI